MSDGLLLSLLLVIFLHFFGRCRPLRRRALRSECVCLLVVSSKYVVFGLLFRTILLHAGVLFGRRVSKTFYVAGVLSDGWDGCNGVVVGAWVQSTCRISFVLFEIANAPSGSHTYRFIFSSSQHVIAQHGIR